MVMPYIAWTDTKWSVTTTFDPYNATENISRKSMCDDDSMKFWAAIDSELTYDSAHKQCKDLEGRFPELDGENKVDVKDIFSKFHTGLYNQLLLNNIYWIFILT